MELPADTKIAGWKTVKDWKDLRPQLISFNNSERWSEAYDTYFIGRLTERYLQPVRSIRAGGYYSGEGFSIMTIACSLVEFLESTYQGKNYRFRRKKDPPLAIDEYDKSGDLFCSFLTSHAPFSAEFDLQLADSFYREVRCGLLHEARTNGEWTIWGKSDSGSLAHIKANEKVIFRDDFFAALENWITNDYKEELSNSTKLKEAFVRKFDRLCHS